MLFGGNCLPLPGIVYRGVLNAEVGVEGGGDSVITTTIYLHKQLTPYTCTTIRHGSFTKCLSICSQSHDFILRLNQSGLKI